MRKSLFILILILQSCNDESHLEIRDSYKIIIIAGQSNTHAGPGFDPILDTSHASIKQLGRFYGDDYKIIPAEEPLQHHVMIYGEIGFGLTFAKLVNEHLDDGKNILIIPCGKGGTGFIDQNWNKGDPLYNDLINRYRLIKNDYPDSKLLAILWHQGEKDVGNDEYQNLLDGFINNLRKDVGNPSTPFILGGMVPYWVNLRSAREVQQQIISTTTLRISNVGYADPNLPFVIEKSDNDFDAIHFDAVGQREMGRRYFEEYLRLTK